jgi:protein-S-isoprenylcysteine O-methyltransferase Ste14
VSRWTEWLIVAAGVFALGFGVDLTKDQPWWAQFVSTFLAAAGVYGVLVAWRTFRSAPRR